MSEGTFHRLAAAPCGAPADLLVALAAEFGAVGADELHAQLDDHARRRFGLSAWQPAAQAQRLAEVMQLELGLRAASGWDCAALLVDRVLVSGRGHPVVLATVGADLCRRAGVPAGVFSSPERWFVGLGSAEQPVLLDASLPAACPRAPSRVRGHCAHELAFCALSGLVRGYAATGRREQARHACRLRLTLPIDEDLRATVRRELDALEGG